MKTKKNQYNILKNHTLDEYKAKYDISKAIVLTKDAVDNFNKKHKHAKTRNNIFHGRNWWLIDGDYYEIGEYLEIKPSLHKSHGAGFKIALASILGGVGAAGALGGGGYVIYKAVQAYNPTPGPEPEPVPETKGYKILDTGEIKVTDIYELEEVIVPEKSSAGNPTFLKEGNFSGCFLLKKVTLPKTITEIPNHAFNRCSALEEVNLPDDSQITKIGDSAFYECENLKTFNIPKSLKSLGDWTFYSSGIEVLDFSQCSDLTSVGDRAFQYCGNLTKCLLPDSVTELGSYAFNSCYKMVECRLPSGLTEISDEMFDWDSNLATLTLPTNLTRIGKQAFRYCSSLTSSSINLKSGLITIDESAFYGCCSLDKITIPSSVTTVGNRSFIGCANLQTIYVDSDAALKDLNTTTSDYDEYLTTGLFRNGVKVYINNSTTIDPTNYPDDLKDSYTSSSGSGEYIKVYDAKDDMFFYPYGYDKTYAKTIRTYRPKARTFDSAFEIPSQDTNGIPVVEVMDLAFANTNLQEVTVPSSVLSFGYDSVLAGVFSNCQNLTKVNFATDCKLQSILNETFKDCKQLIDITLPDSVTHLGYWCFENCTSLQSINIPSKVDYYYECFKGCTNLKTAIIDCEKVAKLFNDDGNLYDYAETVKVNKKIGRDNIGYAITSRYNVPTEPEESGYYVCTRK